MSDKLRRVSNNLITELAFELILNSEEIEDYRLNKDTIKSEDEHMDNISKTVVLEFLADPNTKITVAQDEETYRKYLIASNSVSHETIKISGLADHYLALLNIVEKAAQKKVDLRSKKGSSELINKEFIEQVNLSLQPHREEEIGIGKYRELDYLDRPVEMRLKAKSKKGVKDAQSLALTPQKDVEKEMEALVNWVNNEAFKPGRDKLHDIAEFHARFLKIHPFTDGNGRTVRLPSNYLLLINNMPMVSFPIEHKQEYYSALNYYISRDFKESTDEIVSFEKFIKNKYFNREKEGFVEYFMANNQGARTKNKTYKVTDKQDVAMWAAETMQKQRDSGDPFLYLTDFFRKHQINLSSHKAISDILNNYGNKALGQHIDVGSVYASQTDFEQL